MLEKLRFCLVTELKTSFRDYKPFLEEVIAGGLSAVQLRAKNKTKAELLALAQQFKAFLTPQKIPLIINDHLDIALAVDAEGIHLGQEDCLPEEARERLGPHKLIGQSIESFADLNKANQCPHLDYVAASAVFKSSSKTNLKTIFGLEGLAQLCQQARYPVLAIGGIKLDNLEAVLAQGAYGVALISALHAAADPKQEANLFAKVIAPAWSQQHG